MTVEQFADKLKYEFKKASDRYYNDYLDVKPFDIMNKTVLMAYSNAYHSAYRMVDDLLREVTKNE